MAVLWVVSLVLLCSGSCESNKAGVKESGNEQNVKFTIKLDDVLADLDTFETEASDLVDRYGRLKGHCTLVAHEARPSDCSETSSSGVTTIYPDGVIPLTVYCDQDTDGGGWTVFQRRQDGSVNFYRGWAEYQQGFGNPRGEFWLGLDALHMLTSSQTYELRVDLEKFDGTTGYATYNNFSISDSSNNYTLHVGSFTGGNAGDSLFYHEGYQFSTYDAENDVSFENCASYYHGAWWYNTCYLVNLNGDYKTIDSMAEDDGLVWYSFDTKSNKFAEMKLRPF